jgi:hypothetical protein
VLKHKEYAVAKTETKAANRNAGPLAIGSIKIVEPGTFTLRNHDSKYAPICDLVDENIGKITAKADITIPLTNADDAELEGARLYLADHVEHKYNRDAQGKRHRKYWVNKVAAERLLLVRLNTSGDPQAGYKTDMNGNPNKPAKKK